MIIITDSMIVIIITIIVTITTYSYVGLFPRIAM